MAKDERGPGTGGEDKLQDVGMQGVSGQGQKPGQDANTVRVLNTRTMLFHNAHLQGRPRFMSKDCGYCRGGLAGALKEIKAYPTNYQMQVRLVFLRRLDYSEPR